MYVFIVVMSANMVGHGVWELLVGWQKVGCRRKGKQNAFQNRQNPCLLHVSSWHQRLQN